MPFGRSACVLLNSTWGAFREWDYALYQQIKVRMYPFVRELET